MANCYGYQTLLPLATWAKIMGLSPWEFSQLGTGFPVDNAAQCAHVWFQYQWQQDFLSREEVGHAISMAEDMIAQELLYYPAPKYFVDEIQQYPRPYNRELYAGGRTVRGELKSVELNWHKVQGGGTFARTIINAGTAIVLSDTDGDGINDTFTLTQATSVTDPNEIAVYFTVADRNSEPVDETWRVRPVRVTISGGFATVKGHSSLLVVPDLTLRTDAQVLDVTVAANYVTALDVYHIYTNDDITTNQQGNAIWEIIPCANPPCSVEYNALCLGARDAELGIVSVDYTPNGSTTLSSNNNWRAPDRVSINYLAGEPLVNGQMSQQMADIVAHLATALLPVEKCGCERSDRIIAYWREVAPASGEGMRASLRGSYKEHPFGPARGAEYAYSKVERLRHLA
jgi:hypothetical protein